jgi:hypothetical protein
VSFWVYEKWRLRARYGECCQLGSMRMWLLGWVCRWACAMYNACSRVVVRCSVLYDGGAREAPDQLVLVYGRAPKVASLGSRDTHSLTLRGRVIGLQCVTLLILKQLHSASYIRCRVWATVLHILVVRFVFCSLWNFRSLVKVSL